MPYLLFSKILSEKLLDFKVKARIVTTPNIKDEKCFYPKFFFLCKTMFFFLLKLVHKEKKNTKSQPKNIVGKTINFGTTMLTKPIKNF